MRLLIMSRTSETQILHSWSTDLCRARIAQRRLFPFFSILGDQKLCFQPVFGLGGHFAFLQLGSEPLAADSLWHFSNDRKA